MDNAAIFFVQNESRIYESRCHSAESAVSCQKSIQDVIRVSHVTAHPVIRSVIRSLPAHRRLQAAIERKLDSLIDAQLETVRAEPNMEKRKEMLGKFRSREWNSLRGDYAMQWRRADREAQRLLHAPK